MLRSREVSRFGSVITLVTQSKNVAVWECDNTCYTIGNVAVWGRDNTYYAVRERRDFERDNTCYTIKKRHGLGAR